MSLLLKTKSRPGGHEDRNGEKRGAAMSDLLQIALVAFLMTLAAAAVYAVWRGIVEAVRKITHRSGLRKIHLKIKKSLTYRADGEKEEQRCI